MQTHTISSLPPSDGASHMPRSESTSHVPSLSPSGRTQSHGLQERHKYTLIALLENRPGVLNRVTSLFRRRGFNLDSLTVGRTDRDELSRMTLVIDGTRAQAQRVERELCKLINVVRVDHLHGLPSVTRDLALIKVMVSAETRPEVKHLCEIFRARIIDIARDSMIVELTGDEAKIEGFVDLLKPHGIVEMVRTGLVAMGRGQHILDRNGFESSWIQHRERIETDDRIETDERIEVARLTA